MWDGPVLLPAETAIAAPVQAPVQAPVLENGQAPVQAPQMLISSARAATLKLTNQRPAAAPHAPVLIKGAQDFTLDAARIIADPALDLSAPLKGPFMAQHLEWPEQAAAALELARLAGILPAFLVNPVNGGEAQPVAASDLAAWADTSRLNIASRAHLPITASDKSEIIAFRSMDDTREHVALVIGEQMSDRPPLVRLHSECLTGDILGSLKCDCGPQLDAALLAMADHAAQGGWGVLLYLRQEGRGIGLINKMRAYKLQDQGFDTVEANQRLGLPEEARDFATAARMLELLGVGEIRLMTNNPRKVEALEAANIRILERVPHQLPANPHNARYLATKRDRSGHLIK